MDPGFIVERNSQKHLPKQLLRTAILNILFGLGFLYLVFLLLPEKNLYYLCWLLSLIGLSMIFHFGLINLLIVAWRFWGFEVKPAFHSPLNSKSLSHFWGKDWNIPFVEMTKTVIYRPISKKWNTGLALILTFLMSGVFHEIAITLPVNADFGRPLGYFILQALFVALERRLRKKYPAKMKKYNKIFLFGALILPLPLVFPPAFTHEILFPLIKDLFSVAAF